MNARIQGYKKKRDVLLIDRTSLFCLAPSDLPLLLVETKCLHSGFSRLLSLQGEPCSTYKTKALRRFISALSQKWSPLSSPVFLMITSQKSCVISSSPLISERQAKESECSGDTRLKTRTVYSCSRKYWLVVSYN